MFSSVQLITGIVMFLLGIKVTGSPIYDPPAVNQLLNGIQPMYSNLLTPNANIPYNSYVLSAQPYQKVYTPSMYQPIRGYINQPVSDPYCVKKFFNPYYKSLLDYHVRQYLQTGDPEILLGFHQQLIPPITFKVSKVLKPCSNKLPADYVGSTSQAERDHEFGNPTRSSDNPTRQTATYSKVATTPNAMETQEINDKPDISNEKNTKSKGEMKNTKQYELKEASEDKNVDSSVDNQSQENQIEQIEYDKIMDYLQKRIQKQSAASKISNKDSSDSKSVPLLVKGSTLIDKNTL